MPIFDESWSGRLRLIGELERADHWHLTADDRCAFFGEYTARAGYGHSSTNQLIHNLKKKPEHAGTPQYVWKGRAITSIAAALRANLKAEALADLAIVPIPPSKPPGAAGFDDRMVRVARAIAPQVDVREALYTAVERDPLHVNQTHRDPAALHAGLALRPKLITKAPAQVMLLDDVLTTGCSFKVCKSILEEVWPHAQIFGVFVARRVIDHAADFAEVSDLDL